MLSAYTANLTANLTVSTLAAPLSKLADLKAAGLMFGVPADSSVARYFRDSKVRSVAALAAGGVQAVQGAAGTSMLGCLACHGAARLARRGWSDSLLLHPLHRPRRPRWLAAAVHDRLHRRPSR